MNNTTFDGFIDMMIETVSQNTAKSIFDKLGKKFGFSEPEEKKPIRLTAEKLKEIRWMTARQIEAICHNGKVPFVIDDDVEAFKQLRWMTQNQLEALFGKDETT